jgi:UDP-4-amino-4-deoxy-L-arabinose-oxoglutarate aminotransferase
MIPHSKPWIIDEDIEAVNTILTNEMLASGKQVFEFEREVATYLGASEALALGSGASAIVMALKVLGVGVGDEVIIPTYVCAKVLDTIYEIGATPVICDIGDHWTLTVNAIEPFITNRTKAIIIVHIFGISADVNSFLSLNIPIIEDCCQAFGGEINGKKVGLLGDVAVFSFHATKCFTTGLGGMILSNKVKYIDKINQLKKHSISVSPMSDLQAALGRQQLLRYHDFLNRRQEIANEYFNKLPIDMTARLAKVRNNSIFFRFPLWIDLDFEGVKQFCERHGFAVRKGVDTLLHRSLNQNDVNFDNAVAIYNSTVCLPIYPALNDIQLQLIIETVIKIKSSLDLEMTVQ